MNSRPSNKQHKQLICCIKKHHFVEVIVAVGDSKSAVRSAEFYWYKFQWGSNW